MGLKIFSNNMDEPNIKNALKNTDIDPLKEKLQMISYKAEKYKNLQNNDLIEEDEFAIVIIERVYVFYGFVMIQTIIALFLGVFQIIRFKKAIINLL